MDKMIRNVLGPKIKYFRKQAGLTQEFLAARLNVDGYEIDRTIISKIENQTRELYDYEIIAIVKALQINYNELFK